MMSTKVKGAARAKERRAPNARRRAAMFWMVSPASVKHGPRGGAYIVFDVETGPGHRDADVVRLTAGDEAIRARTPARPADARRHVRVPRGKQVELVETTDFAAVVLDVEFATR